VNGKLVPLLSLLLAAGAARAESGPLEPFAGSWEGRGTYILHGDTTSCREFGLVFASPPGSFVFVSGRRLCDKHQESFTEVRMEARGGALWLGEQRVGSYDADLVQAAFRQPEGDGRWRNWRMSMRREGSTLVYEESRRMDGDATPMISFAGLLTLQPAP
jgi:hypothetical protein